jgi:N-acetylmuramoyl-L-alanine amidase
MSHNSEPRPASSRIRHVLIHTNQGPNPADVFPDLSAERLKAYLDRTDHDPVSYHVLEDDDSEIIYLPDNMMSYSARDANPIGLNICFLGYAEWSREEWLRHPQMLARGARKAAQWCRLYNIPPVKLVPRDVVDKKFGVIGHADWTYAMKIINPEAKDSHTDPGANFPWDNFLDMMTEDTEEEDAMQIDNHPLRGQGRLILLYPIGSAGADNIEAWVSASSFTKLGAGEHIEVFAQGDQGGKHNWKWVAGDLDPNTQNLRKRPGVYLQDGVTKLVVTWDLRSSDNVGVLCVESRKRPKPAA